MKLGKWTSGVAITPRNIDGFSGNGDVYAVIGGEAIRYPTCNFDAERLDKPTYGTYDIGQSEPIVGFGFGTESKRKQVRLLRKLIEMIERDEIVTAGKKVDN